MKVSLYKLIESYLENKDEVLGWCGYTYHEGNSAEDSYVLIQTFTEDEEFAGE